MERMSAGDTACLLGSAALVMLMTPALGFFYGGLVRRKNVLSTLMHSFFILCLISVQWMLWGYALALGRRLGVEPDTATEPHDMTMVNCILKAINRFMPLRVSEGEEAFGTRCFSTRRSGVPSVEINPMFLRHLSIETKGLRL